MKIKLSAHLIAFVILFSSCNNPLDRSYSTSTYVQDIAEMREDNKVSSEDIELLTKYITLSKVAGQQLEGQTYEEILERIKSIRDANLIKSDQLKIEQDANRERFSSYLKVNLSAKTFTQIDNKDQFDYTVTLQNTSTKDITMVVGSISLNDLIDREIKNIQVVVDDEIKAGSTLTKTYSVPYNHGDETDKRIRSKELVDIRVVWNPVKIVFKEE